MARRRHLTSDSEGAASVPARLRRFNPDDWPVDGQPPAHWKADVESVGLWYGVKAHQAWLEARRAWEAESGIRIAWVWEQRVQAARAAARTLAEFNEPYDEAHFVDGDDLDPRWPAA